MLAHVSGAGVTRNGAWVEQGNRFLCGCVSRIHSLAHPPHLAVPRALPLLPSYLLLHPSSHSKITMARTLAVVALLALAASASVSARSLRQAEAAPKMLDSE